MLVACAVASPTVLSRPRAAQHVQADQATLAAHAKARPASPASDHDPSLLRIDAAYRLESRAEAALVTDGTLLELQSPPLCDDADVGFRPSESLREVVRRYALGRAPLAPKARARAFAANASLALVHSNSYFVASVLADAADQFAWWQRELVKLLLLLGADDVARAAGGASASARASVPNVFVSLVQSAASTDSTAYLVRGLAGLLDELRVRNHVQYGVAADGAAAAGGVVAAAAALRNAALRPLSDVGEGQAPTHVLFLDAVYFCARGVLEQLQPVLASRRKKPAPPAAAVAGVQQQQQPQQPQQPQPAAAAAAAARPPEPPAPWVYEGADVACATAYSAGAIEPLDLWSARELSGRVTGPGWPGLGARADADDGDDATAVGARSQDLVEVAPMATCWNSIAIVRADAVLAAGVRFRAAAPHECPSTAQLLFVQDLAAAGFGRVVQVRARADLARGACPLARDVCASLWACLRRPRRRATAPTARHGTPPRPRLARPPRPLSPPLASPPLPLASLSLARAMRPAPPRGRRCVGTK
jgi:hypothetical protein